MHRHNPEAPTRCRSFTSVLAGSNQVDDVWMMAQLAEDLQLPRKVPVVILRGKLCRQSSTGRGFQGKCNRLCLNQCVKSYLSAFWLRHSFYFHFSWPWLWSPGFRTAVSFIVNHVSKDKGKKRVKSFQTWPKFPSPITSSNFMSSHSKMG